MSQLPPSPPPGYYPPPSPVGPSGRGEPPKLIAILALVFGAAALLLGLLPVAGIFFGGIFGTAAIVLGIIGLLKSHKVMSTMGIALAVVGTIVSWAIAGAVFNAADYEDGAADPPTSSAEPTTETATRQPTTSAEPTQEPTTSAEPTQEPTTSAEPTQEPTTSAEPTQEPTTSAEPTEAPTTEAEPTTSAEPTENSGGQAEGSFGDGTWTVGEDIEAGTYSTTVPDDSFGCYWERLSGFSGGLDDIITNAIIQPGATATVTIDSSDAGFTSDGCGTWASAESNGDSGGETSGSFGDGTWTVGEDIEAGTYSTTVPDDSFGCYWERLSGFSGELDDIITNAIVEPGSKATVTINSSDAGFTSDGCGTWEQED